MTWMKEGMKKWMGSSKVPAAFALFPKRHQSSAARMGGAFLQRTAWTEMPRGGHFAAMEEPELLAEDIRIWFRTFRGGRGT